MAPQADAAGGLLTWADQQALNQPEVPQPAPPAPAPADLARVARYGGLRSLQEVAQPSADDLRAAWAAFHPEPPYGRAGGLVDLPALGDRPAFDPYTGAPEPASTFIGAPLQDLPGYAEARVAPADVGRQADWFRQMLSTPEGQNVLTNPQPAAVVMSALGQAYPGMSDQDKLAVSYDAGNQVAQGMPLDQAVSRALAAAGQSQNPWLAVPDILGAVNRAVNVPFGLAQRGIESLPAIGGGGPLMTAPMPNEKGGTLGEQIERQPEPVRALGHLATGSVAPVAADVLTGGALTPAWLGLAGLGTANAGAQYAAGNLSGKAALEQAALNTAPFAIGPAARGAAGVLGEIARGEGGALGALGRIAETPRGRALIELAQSERGGGPGEMFPGQPMEGKVPPMEAPAGRPGGEVPLSERPQLELSSPQAPSLFETPAQRGVEHTAVPTDRLVYDPAMQARAVEGGRTFDPKVVKQIVKNYDPNLMDELTVAPTPGKPGYYTVLGGMHRGPALSELGLPAPVKVLPLDLTNPAEYRIAQQVADQTNAVQRDVSLRGLINIIDRAGTEDIAALRERYPRWNDQQFADAIAIRGLPGDIVEKLDRLPPGAGKVGIAAEVGSGMRRYGISQQEAAGLYQQMTSGPKTKLPTRAAVRETIDTFGAEIVRARQQAGLPGFEGMPPNALTEAMANHARLTAEVKSAQEKLAKLAAQREALVRATGLGQVSPMARASSTGEAGSIAAMASGEGAPAPAIRQPPEATVSTVTPGGPEPGSNATALQSAPEASLPGRTTIENPMPASVAQPPPAEPPGPPSQPPPSEPPPQRAPGQHVPRLPDIETVATRVETADGSFVRNLAGRLGINPSLLRETPVGKLVTARQRLDVAIDSAAGDALSQIDALAQRYTGRTPVRTDAVSGRMHDVKPLVEGASLDWHDVFSRPGDYALSPAQRRYIELYNAITRDTEAMRVEAGLPPRAAPQEEGASYVPRKAKVVRGVELRRASNAARQRVYERAEEGTAQGIQYENDPRASLATHVRQAYEEAANNMLSEALRPYKILPSDLIPAGLKGAVKDIGDRLARAQNAILAFQRAGRGEQLPAGTIASIERTFPELAGRVADASSNPETRRKMFAKLIEEIRGKPYTARTPSGNPAVRYRGGLMEPMRLEVVELRSRYKEAMARARTAETAPGSLFGPDQPETIAIGRWRNGMFQRGDADLLRAQLGEFGRPPAANPLARGIEIGANYIRQVGAGADFAAGFIQGLTMMVRHPAIWGKSEAEQFRVFFDPPRLARLRQSYGAEAAEMREYGTPTAGEEFFGAARPGGGITLPMPAAAHRAWAAAARQTLGRFQLAYDGFAFVARAELTRALKSAIPEAEMRQGAIRNLTGGLDTRTLGVGPSQRGFEGVWLAFSPRLLRSTFALLGQAALEPGSPGGREAISSLASLAAGATAFYMATGLALGRPRREIEEGLNPLAGKRFLSYNINGDWIGVGGQVRAITQLMVTAMVRPQDLKSTSRFNNPLIAFYANRGAPGVSMAQTVGEGLTGYNLDPYNKIDNPGDMFLHLGTSAIPFVAMNALERQGPAALGLGALGLRTSHETPFEQRGGPDFVRRAQDAGLAVHMAGARNAASVSLKSWDEAWPRYGGYLAQQLGLAEQGNLAGLRNAFIDKWLPGYHKEFSGVGDRQARADLAALFDGNPLVRDYEQAAKEARLNFWRQHPDLLDEAQRTGFETLNKDERAILAGR